MKKIRKISASLLALAVVLSMTSCATDNTRNEGTGTTNADSGNTSAADKTDDVSAETEAVEYSDSMEITWMAHYDLNPGEGQDRSTALAMFEDEYGGKINYQATTWDARFDDLAKSVLADQGPDIFPYEWLAFPYGVMKNQYNSVDEIIDWNDPLWSGMKTAADGFVYKDKHYVAPIDLSESLLLIYDKTAIEEEGLQDPYELYLNGEWTWDTFKELMVAYCAGGEGRIGCCGAFGRSMVMSTGETFVTYEDGKFLNNIKSPNIDRAQQFLCDIAKQGLTGNGEWMNARQAFEPGNVLFFGTGNWDIEVAMKTTQKAGREIFVVTMPRDPQSENLYVAENLQGIMWVSGSNKAKGVKTWLECNRKAATDPECIQKTKETTMANSGWTEEIYDAVMDIRSSKFIPVFDYGYGVSSEMNGIIENLYNVCCFDNEANTGWANIRDNNSQIIDKYIGELEK